MLNIARHTATLCLLALIVLCLVWELWLAPARPGGTWLVFKTVPLLLPLRGFLYGKRYTFQWMSLAIWFYFMEGAVRATSDINPSSCRLAAIEAILSLILFAACTVYARQSAPSRLQKESTQ